MMNGENTSFMMPVAPSYGGMGGGFGGWGGDGWWIILFLLFGWGNNGFGNNGGVGAEVQRGFDHNATTMKLDGITQGICDATYALNNTVTNGFHGVDRAVCDLGYKLAQCCCDTQRAIDGVNYNLATQSCDTRNLIQTSTRDIIDNANGNTRAILDFLTQDKIESLRAENQSLKLAASQANQNAYLTATIDAGNAELLRRINPTPVPAYTVPAPYPYGYGYSACGCAA